jgi:hypothetical protein
MLATRTAARYHVAMRRSAPSAVREILPVAVPGLAEHLVEQHIRREWRHLVGPDVARRCQPGALSGDCLQVVVDNSPWLQEMTLRTPEILTVLAGRFGGRVRSLRVTLGTLPRPESREPSTPRVRSERLDAADRAAIDELVAGLPDPSLAESMRRLLIKWRRSSSRPKRPEGRSGVAPPHIEQR